MSTPVFSRRSVRHFEYQEHYIEDDPRKSLLLTSFGCLDAMTRLFRPDPGVTEVDIVEYQCDGPTISAKYVNEGANRLVILQMEGDTFIFGGHGGF